MACIEDHQFQPNNYWNGRWRSQWCITLPQGSAAAELRGILKVQVNNVVGGHKFARIWLDTHEFYCDYMLKL